MRARSASTPHLRLLLNPSNQSLAAHGLPRIVRMHADRIRVSPLVRGSISDDGLVLLDVRAGVVFASNVVGARIWRLIEEERPSAEIAACIATEFHTTVARASRDVDAFVTALCDRGLASCRREGGSEP